MLDGIENILINTEPRELIIENNDGTRDVFLTARYHARSLAKTDAKSTATANFLYQLYCKQFFKPKTGDSPTIEEFRKKLTHENKDTALYIEMISHNGNLIAFTFHEIAKIHVDDHTIVVCKHGPSSLINQKDYQSKALITILHMRMAFAVAALYKDYPCYGYYAASSPHSFTLSHIFANYRVAGEEICVDHYPHTHYYETTYLKHVLEEIYPTFYHGTLERNGIAIQLNLHAQSDYFQNDYRQLVDITRRQSDQWNFYFSHNTRYNEGYAIPVLYSLNQNNFIRSCDFFNTKGFALADSIHTEFKPGSSIRGLVEISRRRAQLLKVLPVASLHVPLADIQRPRPRIAPMPAPWKKATSYTPHFWLSSNNHVSIPPKFSATKTQINLGTAVFTTHMINLSTKDPDYVAYLRRDFLAKYSKIVTGATEETIARHFKPLANRDQVSEDTVYLEIITGGKFHGFNLYRVIEMQSSLGTIKIIHVGPALILDTTTSQSALHELTLLLNLRFAFYVQLKNSGQPCYIYHKTMFPLEYCSVAGALNHGDYVPHAKFKTPASITCLMQDIAQVIYPGYKTENRNGDLMIASQYGKLTDAAFSPSIKQLQQLRENGSIIYLYRFMATNFVSRYGDGYVHGFGLSFLAPLSRKTLLF